MVVRCRTGGVVELARRRVGGGHWESNDGEAAILRIDDGVAIA